MDLHKGVFNITGQCPV